MVQGSSYQKRRYGEMILNRGIDGLQPNRISIKNNYEVNMARVRYRSSFRSC